jgi:CrcB protein
MKGIEFIFLAIGAIAGAFLRYKIASTPPILLGALLANILIVNAIGSFILGLFCYTKYSSKRGLINRRTSWG